MTIYLLGLLLSALAIYLCALWVHKAARFKRCTRCCGYKIELIPGTGKMIDCHACKGTGERQ